MFCPGTSKYRNVFCITALHLLGHTTWSTLWFISFFFLGPPISRHSIQALFSGFYCIWNVFLSSNRFIIYLYWTSAQSVDTDLIKTQLSSRQGVRSLNRSADTNISTLYPYPPAAVSYIQSHTQQASLALFSLQPARYYMGAAPVVEATGDTCLLFSARLGRLPRVDPRVNYFQSSWDLYHSHTGASGTTAPQGGGFPFYVSMGRDCHPSSRCHRSIWPAACSWTLSRIGFFITHTKWLCQGLY